MDFKEEVAKSLVDIAADFNFKNPKKVFPVLQITYLQMGEEKPAPEWLRHLSETCRPTEAEALVYLFKSGNEYYYLSLSYTSEAVITDGKALGEYHEDITSICRNTAWKHGGMCKRYSVPRTSTLLM